LSERGRERKSGRHTVTVIENETEKSDKKQRIKVANRHTDRKAEKETKK
jgi:hypothetical protein